METVKMKKKELFGFEKGLNSSKFEHPSCTFAVNRNKRTVNPLVEDLRDSVKPTDEYKEFQKEREELAKKYSKKDDKGDIQYITIPNPEGGPPQKLYDIEGVNDEKSKYSKELAKLEEKHREAVDTHDAKVKKLEEETLEEEIEIEVYMLELDFLEKKNEKCPQHVMDGIFWMITDGERK